jgi:hypothetical protein
MKGFLVGLTVVMLLGSTVSTWAGSYLSQSELLMLRSRISCGPLFFDGYVAGVNDMILGYSRSSGWGIEKLAQETQQNMKANPDYDDFGAAFAVFRVLKERGILREQDARRIFDALPKDGLK